MGSSQFRAIVRRFYKRRHSRDRRQLTTLWTSDKSPRFLTFSSAILFLLFLCKLLSRIYICPDGFQKLARKPKNIGDSGVRYDGGYYLKTIGLFRDPSPIPAERFLPHIKVYYAVDIYLQSWSLGVIKISKKGFLRDSWPNKMEENAILPSLEKSWRSIRIALLNVTHQSKTYCDRELWDNDEGP